MFVRVARFEGATPTGIDEELDSMRAQLASPEGLPAALRAATRVVVLVDRSVGTTADLTFCETEGELRAVDQALDAMSPSSAASGRRASVEVFEVGLDVHLG